MTSASRSQSGGNDIWTFYFDPSSNYSWNTYWVNANPIGSATQTGSDSLEISVATGSYGMINNAIYVYGGTNSLPSYVNFASDGSYSITNQ